METRLSVQTKQHQQLSQEKIQSLQLLHMTSIEVQNEIDLMIDDNPMLEREESSTEPEENWDGNKSQPETGSCDSAEEDNVFEAESPLEAMYDNWPLSSVTLPPVEQIAVETDFREELFAELRCLPYDQRDTFFIGCLIEELDERGFLTETLENITRDYERIANESGILDASLKDWQLALDRLRRMDPPGIGASSPVEAMILQAERLASNNKLSPDCLTLIKQILRRDLLELARHNRQALLKVAGQNEALLDDVLALLNTLSPYPICKSSHTPQYVQPDIVIRLLDKTITATIPSSLYQSIRLKTKDEISELPLSISQALASRYSSEAKSFIRGLHARQNTLQKIGDALAREQLAFFEKGPSALKPWKISDLAKELGINDSTVSRAIDGKFVLCVFGMYELRSFFSTAGVKSCNASGQKLSELGSAQIGALISELIAKEDPAQPLTDDALCKKLKNQNIAIARRTVAKYREIGGIPSARVRKRH